jgi:hypothetical protein
MTTKSAFNANTLWEAAKETESLHKLLEFLKSLPPSDRRDNLTSIVQRELTTLISDPLSFDERSELIQLRKQYKSIHQLYEQRLTYVNSLLLLCSDNDIDLSSLDD